MSNFLKQISEKIFPPLETYIADSEADGGPRARGGDIGYLPGDIEEKMRRYESRPDAGKLLAQGMKVGEAIQRESISTTHANRTKQIFLKSRKLRR